MDLDLTRAEMSRHDRGVGFCATSEALDACMEWLRSCSGSLVAPPTGCVPSDSTSWSDPSIRVLTFYAAGMRIKPGSQVTAARFDFTKAQQDILDERLLMVELLPMVRHDGVADVAPWGARLQRSFGNEPGAGFVLRGEVSCNARHFDRVDVADAGAAMAARIESAVVGYF